VAGFVNTVMNLQVPYKAGNFLTSWVPISFSRYRDAIMTPMWVVYSRVSLYFFNKFTTELSMNGNFFLDDCCWINLLAPRILDLGTRWRWVVSFTLRPIYPQRKRPWYPLDRRHII
jgi:hypothetical protein